MAIAVPCSEAIARDVPLSSRSRAMLGPNE
jgi:hypothetical protein